MAEIKIEMGKLMAQFSSLNQAISELKKGMENTNKEVLKLHTELMGLSGSIFQKMEKTYIKRSELAPIKGLLSVAAVTLFSAICLSITELLVFKVWG